VIVVVVFVKPDTGWEFKIEKFCLAAVNYVFDGVVSIVAYEEVVFNLVVVHRALKMRDNF
jgi:hypothetical protein